MIDHTFDKRLVERQLRNGNLDQSDYDKHISTLPDVADNAELFEATLYEAEEEGAEEAAAEEAAEDQAGE